MKHSNTQRNASDYNGWANFETWGAYFCLSNDEGNYHIMRELARSHSDLDRAAEAIRDYLAARNPLEDHGSVYSELLDIAFHSVNWREIAEAFREE